MNSQYYVYLMTNKSNQVLYTGVTNDLRKRIYEHKEKLVEGFTKRYNLTKLVYFESCGDIQSAISREKQIKAGSRQKKIDLINGVNNKWRDLYNDLQEIVICHRYERKRRGDLIQRQTSLPGRDCHASLAMTEVKKAGTDKKLR